MKRKTEIAIRVHGIGKNFGKNFGEKNKSLLFVNRDFNPEEMLLELKRINALTILGLIYETDIGEPMSLFHACCSKDCADENCAAKYKTCAAPIVNIEDFIQGLS